MDMSETYRDGTENLDGNADGKSPEEVQMMTEKNQEDAGPLLNIPQLGNSLTVVMRDAKTLSFMKFVSANAPSDRIDLKMVVPINEDLGHSDSESEEMEE